MKEKNLPIKLVMQKAEDTKSNDGGGRVKFFRRSYEWIANSD